MGAPGGRSAPERPQQASGKPHKRLIAAVRLRSVLRFRVLGAVEVEGDGGQVALAGPKQRALVAMLALDGNAVVSRDRLIEGLWGERPPADVEHALDVQVSALRRVLAAAEDGRLGRRSPGY